MDSLLAAHRRATSVFAALSGKPVYVWSEFQNPTLPSIDRLPVATNPLEAVRAAVGERHAESHAETESLTSSPP